MPGQWCLPVLPEDPPFPGVLVCVVVVLVPVPEEPGAAAAPAIPAIAPTSARAEATSTAFSFVEPFICMLRYLLVGDLACASDDPCAAKAACTRRLRESSEASEKHAGVAGGLSGPPESPPAAQLAEAAPC